MATEGKANQEHADFVPKTSLEPQVQLAVASQLWKPRTPRSFGGSEWVSVTYEQKNTTECSREEPSFQA